jgi:hypothetical protein
MPRHVTQDAFTGVLATLCRSTTTYAFIARGSNIWVTLPGLGLGLLHKPSHSLILLSLPILVTYICIHMRHRCVRLYIKKINR